MKERLNLDRWLVSGGSRPRPLPILCRAARRRRGDLRVVADRSLLPSVIDETLRWTSPVQSATRHTLAPIEWRDVRFPAGATVNCMIGAANRDPGVFRDPDRFDIDRPNLRNHLGFAAGPHFCLGSHLARLECERLLDTLLDRWPTFALAEPVAVRGFEFRQPRRLLLDIRGRG